MGRIAITIWMVFTCMAVRAQQAQAGLASGNDLYKKGEFEKAATQFAEAKKAPDNDGKTSYNLGNALYKSGKKDAATQAYDNAISNKKTPAPLKAKAFFNKGVSLTRQKKLQESIDAYKNALRINPRDQEARENLQLALNELKKQEQQKQQQNQQNQQNKQQEKPQDKPQNNQQEQNKSNLTKQQVEQNLNMLRQEEKRLQQSVQKKNNPGMSNAKDW